jgi:hypothetical protein
LLRDSPVEKDVMKASSFIARQAALRNDDEGEI